ncbi:pyridoxamine 5'-phosphate oxidase family protein [Amycolatopsis suaedae]|uniref:Pyridoxamine 5'-phosphate oxidase n=1 Tax=Amycolatopsis suaedae TaxID=2510978 RepID=A0A4V2ELR0_9PSEU|nr:pyridoxamine 5'-phosphate oxidase family protein [Amycolatopsis suaedae]RZQ62435.1 pyridoxamine 5'-phosphate oxidase [Amycolatopsis suaedae]
MVVESTVPPPELTGEFVRVAHRIVWCTLATVDRRGRPRSRVVHPYWEVSGDEVVGWVFTRPTPLKVAHLDHSPFASCSYWDPGHETAVAECAATFAGDEGSRRRVWDLFETAAPPLGFDPRMLGSADHRDERITVLALRPWRLKVGERAWRRSAGT